MDGAIDLRLILTIGGILFSVAGAAAVGKMQIKVILENLVDMEKRLRDMDKRVDTLEAQGGTQKQRIDILAQMSSPENLRREHMQMSKLLSDTEQALERVKHLEVMHNTVHPPVSSERKAT